MLAHSFFIQKKPLQLALILLCSFCISSCNFEKTELPTWEVDLLGPLVKTTIKTSDIPDLQNYNFSKTDEITMAEIGFPSGAVPVIPPFQNIKITLSKTITSDFTMLTFKSGTMSFSFTNNFLFNILSGAVVTLKSNGVTIFTHKTPSTIPINGKYAITNVSLAGLSITDEFTYDISFSSDGASNGGTITNNAKLTVVTDIINAEVTEARIKSSYKFSAISATEFSLNPNTITINEVTGLLTLKVINRLPFDYTLQAYFSSDKLKSSDDTPLFAANENTLIPAATINSMGQTTQASEKTLLAQLDIAKYTKIRDAKYILFDVSLKSFPSGIASVAIRQADSVNVKVIADIKLKANSK